MPTRSANGDDRLREPGLAQTDRADWSIHRNTAQFSKSAETLPSVSGSPFARSVFAHVWWLQRYVSPRLAAHGTDLVRARHRSSIAVLCLPEAVEIGETLGMHSRPVQTAV